MYPIHQITFESTWRGSVANKYSSSPFGVKKPLHQGEFLTDVVYTKLEVSKKALTSNQPTVTIITHPFSIIVTQDCDLTWDFNARVAGDKGKDSQKVPNVLLCEMGTANDFYQKQADYGSKWDNIKKNKVERVQFFEAVPANCDQVKIGLPELCADFKRYFTIPTDELYMRIQLRQIQRRCYLRSPYLEHFCTRFHYFHYRVGLPEDHQSE